MGFNKPGGNVDGEDISPSSVSTEEASIEESLGKAAPTSSQSIPSATGTQIPLGSVEIEGNAASVIDVDLSNNELIIKKSGKYEITHSIRYEDSSNWSQGDRYQVRAVVGGSLEAFRQDLHIGSSGSFSYVTIQTTASIDVTSPNVGVILEAFQESGGTIGVQAASNSTYTEIKRVG